MSRIDIEIDDELIAACMSRFGLPTIDLAVDHALRALLSSTLDPTQIYATAGLGWDGPEDTDEHWSA